MTDLIHVGSLSTKMFRELIEEWRGYLPPFLEQEGNDDHHDASAHATQASKDVGEHDKHATELHHDPNIPHLEKHGRAIHASWQHGQAELSHLAAGKLQYMKGNEELADRHLTAAKNHRDDRKGWMGAAHDAHLKHREEAFMGHVPDRSMNKAKWNDKDHPYEFEKWAHKEADSFGKHADGIEPWSPRHRDAHHKASKYWGAASEASRQAADTTGPGTEDHSYYAMRAHHANVNHMHHKAKTSL